MDISLIKNIQKKDFLTAGKQVRKALAEAFLEQLARKKIKLANSMGGLNEDPVDQAGDDEQDKQNNDLDDKNHKENEYDGPDNKGSHEEDLKEGVQPNVNDIMKWENGDMDEDEEANFFQGLVDSGTIHHLQGMYGRRCQDLINAGLVHESLIDKRIAVVLEAVSKKDFIATAKTLADHKASLHPKDKAGLAQHSQMANKFADQYAGQNPRFDRHKFLTACGLKV
jgi:hypothetical protein